MDLYVNFWGLKHNFKKIRGVFEKLPKIRNFLRLPIYFSKEKPQINLGRSNRDLRSGFK
jgi:hypothetical protein